VDHNLLVVRFYVINIKHVPNNVMLFKEKRDANRSLMIDPVSTLDQRMNRCTKVLHSVWFVLITSILITHIIIIMNFV